MSKSGAGMHVLLTGANGFVASHILFILIERGYAVTATVRSQSKADDIIKTHPSWKDKVEFAVVADFTSEEPFDDLFRHAKKPFNYVIHAASPANFEASDIQKEVIEPAEMGTTEILKATHEYGGPTIKRFIILSSAVAVMNSFEDLTKEGKPYTEKDWNPVTAEQAIERHDPVLGYNVSKIRAESLAWEYMKQNKPSFDLTVINPDIITGPMIHPINGPGSINSTNQFAVSSFIDGTHKQIEGVKFPYYHSVDIRDVARSHVDALSNPAASNQRILLIAGLITPQMVANTIRENFPQLRDRVPKGNPDQTLPTGVRPTGWDMRVSLDILAKGTKEGRWDYINVKTSIVDAVKSMFELGVI
ncbi:NAD dependent epimerase/dehydratase [Aspergillus sclerotioniger CBS 115572]|uniref:NAD dependent epimerase/dehydratase n=1 Tax=Aspergillus sclerotioniger CBS 115572 TaxID=1450535 RepID=A0A317W9T9_9EURO|nr:NAD dependent epimerase/dehydratase [Aspergillus sclerotioniger CBS 115572]PWY81748.1 NAD dependent epimerase/dehydratase [Aspergillus sclerotioniger CBS 115572]